MVESLIKRLGRLIGIKKFNCTARGHDIPCVSPWGAYILYWLLVFPGGLLVLSVIVPLSRVCGKRSSLSHAVVAIKEYLFGGITPISQSSVDLISYSPQKLPSKTPSCPPVIVVDNFYPDPHEVRRFALDAQYLEHAPLWWVTAWESGPDPRFRVENGGTRYNGPEVRSLLEAAINARIRIDTWNLAGDGWNGAFHLRFGHP